MIDILKLGIWNLNLGDLVIGNKTFPPGDGESAIGVWNLKLAICIFL
jgi:hypothetical protein